LRRGITFGQLLAFLAAALPVLVGLRFAHSTVDLAYLIRAGETMLASHEVLRVDTFTFTVAGEAWLNQQWGAEILLALLHRAGSWEGLAVARLVLVALIFWMEFLACRARGASYRAAGWLTLCALFVSIDGLTIRPQLFGAAFFALTLWMIAERSRRPWLLWCIPPVVLVWANVHGSFVLAPLLLLLTWLEDRRLQGTAARRELGVALACVIVAFVNPFGAGIWAYVANLTTDPEIRRLIEEWQQTRPTSLIGVAFYLSVAGMIALLIADLFPERTTRRDDPARLNLAIAAVLVLLMVPLLPGSDPRMRSTRPPSRPPTDSCFMLRSLRRRRWLTERSRAPGSSSSRCGRRGSNWWCPRIPSSSTRGSSCFPRRCGTTTFWCCRQRMAGTRSWIVGRSVSS